MTQEQLDREIATYLQGVVNALKDEAIYATKEDCLLYMQECIVELGNYQPPETYLQAWYRREFGTEPQHDGC